jgi:Protein of unknown function (DUF3761)
MRLHVLLAAAVFSAAVAAPAIAADTPQQTTMKNCAATWKTMAAADKAKTKYTDYMSTCMKAAPGPKAAGAMPAPSPAASMAMTAKPKADSSMSMKVAAPAGGGSATCKDGKVVTYKKRSGTCSGHGGVATWM